MGTIAADDETGDGDASTGALAAALDEAFRAGPTNKSQSHRCHLRKWIRSLGTSAYIEASFVNGRK